MSTPKPTCSNCHRDDCPRIAQGPSSEAEIACLRAQLSAAQDALRNPAALTGSGRVDKFTFFSETLVEAEISARGTRHTPGLGFESYWFKVTGRLPRSWLANEAFGAEFKVTIAPKKEG